MVKTLAVVMLLALSAVAYADDAAVLAGELDRGADESDKAAKGDQEGLDALNRQKGHLTDAVGTTKAAIDQTEDFRYRDFFSQVLNILNKILAVVMLLAGGGVLGAGIFGVVKRRAANVAKAALSDTEPALAPRPFPGYEDGGEGGEIVLGARSRDGGQRQTTGALRPDYAPAGASNGNGGNGLSAADKLQMASDARAIAEAQSSPRASGVR